MPLINPSGGGGVPTGTASGTNAVAISAGTIASANYSFALGLNSAGTASKAVTGSSRYRNRPRGPPSSRSCSEPRSRR